MNTGETIALIKALGGGGSSLPAVTSSDNGSELIVKNGAWAKQQKKFVVTLTPTAEDFSGTMDKTVAEINAAYEAGMEIWFRMDNGVGQVYEVPCNQIVHTIDEYPNFGAQLVVDGLGLVLLTTYSVAEVPSYYTTIYSLTPAS